MSFAAGFLGGLADGMNAKRDRESRDRALSLMNDPDFAAIGRNEISFGGVDDVARGGVMEGAGLQSDGGARSAGLGSGGVGFAKPERKPNGQSSSPLGKLYVSSGTRAKYKPSADALNISMDFNASPNGGARGTEVVIPDNASPELRAAADRYNQMVADFAARNGISDYPIRGVRTRSENGRGVPFTVHTEPFFNDDTAFQQAIQKNPAEFAKIYREAFSGIPGARLIAPHGVGKDRGAASTIFGNETSYGELIANSLLANDTPEPQAQEAPQTWGWARKFMTGGA